MELNVYIDPNLQYPAYVVKVHPYADTIIHHKLGNGKVFQAVGYLWKLTPTFLAKAIAEAAREEMSMEDMEERFHMPFGKYVQPGLIAMRNGDGILYKPKEQNEEKIS